MMEIYSFNTSEAKVTLHYSNKDEEDEWEDQVFEMSLGGVSVNVFENAPLPSHMLAEIQNPDTISSSNNLYLQARRILTVIKLFGEDNDNNGVADELKLLRAKKWLINEASLKLYVNQDMIAGGSSNRTEFRFIT